MQEEMADIVDRNDNVIGQQTRSEANKLVPGKHFRAVNAFIENDKGQLWIPRRTATKKLFPLGLDVSVGGAVAAGETYEQALIREAQEEINMDIARSGYTLLGYFNPYEHGLSCFTKVYKISMNDVPPYNTDDFCEHFWLTPQELLAWLDRGESCKSDLPKLVRILF